MDKLKNDARFQNPESQAFSGIFNDAFNRISQEANDAKQCKPFFQNPTTSLDAQLKGPFDNCQQKLLTSLAGVPQNDPKQLFKGVLLAWTQLNLCKSAIIESSGDQSAFEIVDAKQAYQRASQSYSFLLTIMDSKQECEPGNPHCMNDSCFPAGSPENDIVSLLLRGQFPGASASNPSVLPPAPSLLPTDPSSSTNSLDICESFAKECVKKGTESKLCESMKSECLVKSKEAATQVFEFSI